MRKQPKVLLIASAFVASVAAAPALLAHDGRDHGMMGRDGMMGNRGMTGMMGSMMQMMEHCSQMMGDGSRQPNDQWRKAPSAPSEKR
ncbi:MAG: hypothetical protein GHHEDOFH_00599 [Pseudorhodoplanes sp.]|nr:hypothetical protein [Pseudorhodoplanes sp.]